MALAREVLLTIGQWGRDPRGLELMWEDYSAAPFSIQLCSRQVFPPFVPPSLEASCQVYVRGFRGRPLLAGEWPARVRYAEALPYLRSWGK